MAAFKFTNTCHIEKLVVCPVWSHGVKLEVISFRGTRSLQWYLFRNRTQMTRAGNKRNLMILELIQSPERLKSSPQGASERSQQQ
jgi:hypothetical protein